MLKWEYLGGNIDCVFRARVPGGWLVLVGWQESGLNYFFAVTLREGTHQR